MMITLRYALAVGAAMLVAGAPADAQLRRGTTATYPNAQTLPSGMCQVWIDGIPANRQPAPTDCTTARRNQPRNSRIIYGTGRSTNVYGNRDPRSIPGTPQYDPRYDPRNSQYDPRLDPRNRGNNGRYDNGQYGDGQYGNNDDRGEKDREKWARKQQKERDKEWKKSRRGNGNNHDDHDDQDDDDRGNGQYGNRDGRGGSGTYGTVQQGCVDMNRDGICDNAQTTRGIPRNTPRPGTTTRVCVDANRDGRCDDGGPLIRVARP